MSKVAILCFGADLRLRDNPALRAALEFGDKILPIFVWAPDEDEAPGAASRWWLHHSLIALQNDLKEHGLPLYIRSGRSRLQVFKSLISEIRKGDAEVGIFYGRGYTPAVIARDTQIKAELSAAGVRVESCNTSLLFEPFAVKNQQGNPYRVFTPFYNALLNRQDEIIEAEGRPKALLSKAKAFKTEGLSVEALELLPQFDWAKDFSAHWAPGEEGALKNLKSFLKKRVEGYRDARDNPAVEGTSKLSPHLHFGEISPRQIWAAVKEQASSRRMSADEGFFLRELIWREFSYHLLFHFPHTVDQPLRPEFEKFPWARNSARFKAWSRGQTGYPIVDAGMRELWQTGYMHNRVRMIAASFLIKDLLQSWQAGAAWFWDTLVDADLPNNTMGWQWTAGSGADASPFFRIFNPALQGEKFDPRGEYVRKYVPELAKLPNRLIHRPQEAPAEVLASCGVVLGKDYPKPLVDHAKARDEALRIFKTL